MTRRKYSSTWLRRRGPGDRRAALRTPERSCCCRMRIDRNRIDPRGRPAHFELSGNRPARTAACAERRKKDKRRTHRVVVRPLVVLLLRQASRASQHRQECLCHIDPAVLAPILMQGELVCTDTLVGFGKMQRLSLLTAPRLRRRPRADRALIEIVMRAGQYSRPK